MFLGRLCQCLQYFIHKFIVFHACGLSFPCLLMALPFLLADEVDDARFYSVNRDTQGEMCCREAISASEILGVLNCPPSPFLQSPSLSRLLPLMLPSRFFMNRAFYKGDLLDGPRGDSGGGAGRSEARRARCHMPGFQLRGVYVLLGQATGLVANY